MQQHELTMCQMVQQIHLGKLNLDQAAVQFNVTRKTVRNWVNKVEQEAERSRQTVAEQPQLLPIRKQTATPDFYSQENAQARELQARVQALEQELQVAQVRALYYETVVKVAEQELGVAIEKKSATKPFNSCS
ncbi:hypothetical protein P1X16_27645 [Hymenobacter sp. YC55]|nr:hypothetical protein [Hymenobacter sp. YC55]